MSDDPTKKASRRHRRGDAAKPAAGTPSRSSRQLDAKAFTEVDQMIGAFAQSAFGKVLPAVMAGFFRGAKSEDELRNPELQAAFMLFFVYGWKDPSGMRIVDAFAAYGPKLQGEQRRVLDVVRGARLSLFVVHGRERENKQLSGRDLLREAPMAVLDHNAFETLVDGDGLLAWYFDVGELARPFGVATQVPVRKLPAVEIALGKLAEALSVARADLPERKPAQTFWTVYRVVNTVAI